MVRSEVGRTDHLGMKTFMNRPGVSLLVVGLVLVFIVRHIVGAIWVIGGVLSPIAFAVGVFAIIGGVYLIARANLGPGA